MDEMVAVVFRDEKAAYDGVSALWDLNSGSTLDVLTVGLIKKESDGTVSTMKMSGAEFPVATAAGTGLGAVIGALAGPAGLVAGGIVGAWAGLIGDLYGAGIDAEFVSDVSAALTPGKWAVVAEVEEEWVTPLDMRMEALGGVVYRTPRSVLRADQWKQERSADKEQLEQLKIEHAKALADRKAKLQAQIEKLSQRIDAKLARAQARAKEVTREYEARLQALEQKAAKEQGDAKAALQARLVKLRSDYQSRAQV
jgi:uncharacterized membrane protein